MNYDISPRNREPESSDQALQSSITLKARLQKSPRWMRFTGLSLALLLLLLAIWAIAGNTVFKPRLVPLSVQQTATAELLATTGRPELGTFIDRFTKVYGQPSNFSSPSDGLYDFNNVLEVFTSPENKRVDSASFLNTDLQGWASLKDAIPACEQFLPGDAIYQRTVELYNPADGVHTGTERVYYSPSLGSLFKASDFTDENGRVTTPGTFAIAFHYAIPGNSGIVSTASRDLQGTELSASRATLSQKYVASDISHIADCNPQIGLEHAER
jgi:hypothetical protein